MEACMYVYVCIYVPVCACGFVCASESVSDTSV